MIVVFGGLNADLFLRVERAPARGETVLCPGYEFRPGGKGANQAVAAARAGAETAMAGCVGRDPFAAPVLDALRAAGVDVGAVRAVEGATGTAAVMVEADGDNRIVVASGANLAARADDIPGAALGPGATLVVQMEVRPEETAAAIRRARAAGGRVVLNLAPARAFDSAAVSACDALVANEVEAEALAGGVGDALSRARSLARRHALDCAVTLGGAGAVLAAADGSAWRIGALDIAPVDTVGAGDAFVGALAAALDVGSRAPEALRRASVAGGLACLREGAQDGLPTAAEIDRALPRLAPAVPVG